MCLHPRAFWSPLLSGDLEWCVHSSTSVRVCVSCLFEFFSKGLILWMDELKRVRLSSSVPRRACAFLILYCFPTWEVDWNHRRSFKTFSVDIEGFNLSSFCFEVRNCQASTSLDWQAINNRGPNPDSHTQRLLALKWREDKCSWWLADCLRTKSNQERWEQKLKT